MKTGSQTSKAGGSTLKVQHVNSLTIAPSCTRESGTLCLAWGISSSLRHLYSIHSLGYLDVVYGLGYLYGPYGSGCHF